MTDVRNFIAGRFVDPVSAAWLDNIEPATGQRYGRLPDSDERDIAHAADVADAAFPAWSRTPVAERSAILMRIADLIDRDREVLARAESIDTGKPLRLARTLDIPRAAENFRFFSGAALHTSSQMHRTELAGNIAALNYTLRQPIGTVGLISPWNLPLYLLSWKIAPAIVTGNTCLCKPSELTPMTAHALAALLVEAGLPAGVVNIVHGLGAKAGAALVNHPRVKAISFTGGTATGASLAREAAPMFKKLSLELGGKNPNLIFEDVDLDEAVAQAVRSSFTNQGQICLCGSRILVARALHDEFVRRLAIAAAGLRMGDPLQEETDFGSLVSKAHHAKVRSYIDLAAREGGKVIIAPAAALPSRCTSGYFQPPVIVVGLDPACRTQREEIFGPVVTVTPFDSEDEAVAIANNTDYGLSATVWTRDLARAHRVAERLHAGTVWINCWLLRDLRVPFGGVKQSGVGREGGDEALRFFTEAKNVCVRYPTQ